VTSTDGVVIELALVVLPPLAGPVSHLSVVFAISTIATYVLLCVFPTAGLRRVRLGAFERYGEVLSGAFIALVGVAFWIWPVV
jgi:hypothetical protein